jgi:hypothetical protein
MMENRQKRIQEEIELEKKKMVPSDSLHASPFEQRTYHTRRHSIDSYDRRSIKKSPVLSSPSVQVIPDFILGSSNVIVTPNPLFEQVEIQVDGTGENEHHKN